MNIKQIIEELNAKPEFSQKLDALNEKYASNREKSTALTPEAVDEIIALFAEYGYTLTKEDIEAAMRPSGGCSACQGAKPGEVGEEELAEIVGGTGGDDGDVGLHGGVGSILPPEDRWDPTECGNIKESSYRCVGFLQLSYCTYYRYDIVSYTSYENHFFECKKGRFDYKKVKNK